MTTTIPTTRTSAPDRRSPGATPSTVAVAVSAIGFGLSPFLATRAFAAGVDPFAASVLRIAALFVVLLPFASQLRGWRRESLVVFAGGAVSNLGFACYLLALDRAPVAAATVVYYTYPIMVLALSAIVWRRPLRRPEVAIAAVILLGVILTVGPAAMTGSEAIALLPALAGPVGWAIFLLVLSGPGGPMPTAPKMLAAAAGGVAVLVPLTFVRTGIGVAPATSDAVVAVAVLTVCTLAIPAALVTWGAPGAGDRATGMIGSFEFVVALAVSWVLMGGDLGPLQLIGAGLVCGAVVAASRSATRA